MSGDDGGEESGGPGAAFQQFVVMEEFLDKLKLLHYETTFCKDLGFKPFSRHYFALPTNPGEQFYSFTSISAWLLQMCGKNFDQPQEYDDPNSTISNILSQLRDLGHQIDFPPNKLKVGCGENCLWVIDRLADEALKAKSFSWKSPTYPEEEAEEDNIIEDEAELNLNKVEEEMMLDDDEEIEEEENILGLDDLNKLNSGQAKKIESSKPENIMESTTDANEWKLEVERVLPQLKVTIRTDNKDWRVHMDQMTTNSQGIEKCMSETKLQLDKLHDEITKTLEKIGSREKYINNQLEHLLVEFRTMQDRLAETKEKYRQGSGGVTERSRILAEVGRA
ncbi:DgyrCDS496 [Dimorphilus gyrociliatus]|uniref:DgyrCDS496 n=1 Tax=Dimorphilus gyrociliatus TaxID=2664684 RepID=A0A7I8V982_9ANNE|nr:DgyrCDS496 [Dimorphilus gyrociliatus]